MNPDPVSGNNPDSRSPLQPPVSLACSTGRSVGWLVRWLLVLVSLLLLGGFGLATTVQPDSRGFGTHQQFGLPPCSFRVALGVPCPSCGMTTSFASFVRGDFSGSIAANPAGFLLAVACLGAIPWSWVSAARGCLYGVWRLDVAALAVLLPITTVCLLQWLLRILPLSSFFSST